MKKNNITKRPPSISTNIKVGQKVNQQISSIQPEIINEKICLVFNKNDHKKKPQNCQIDLKIGISHTDKPFKSTYLPDSCQNCKVQVKMKNQFGKNKIVQRNKKYASKKIEVNNSNRKEKNK